MSTVESQFLAAFDAHREGQLGQAELGYRHVLALSPHHPDALHLLGLIHQGREEFEQAEALIREALQYRESAVYLSNLGYLLRRFSGRSPEVEAAFLRAIEIEPAHVPAHFGLGDFLLGANRHHDAIAAFQTAIEFDPTHVNAHNNLGLALKEAGRLAEAEAVWQGALEIDPRHLHLNYNLGLMRLRSGRFAEAEHLFRVSVESDPQHAAAYNDLGTVLRLTDRQTEAETVYRHALALQPGYADAEWNLALLMFLQGRYRDAWPHINARRRLGKPPSNEPGYPEWRGEPLGGKSLVVWNEQGHGDYIQFARFIPLLRALGVASLTIYCPDALKALFETIPGVDAVVTHTGQLGRQHFWIYYMDLPHLFGITLENLPAQLPYLGVPAERSARWRDLLPRAGKRVGLVWKGSPSHQHNAERSLVDLAVLAPLWSVPGVTFISLQKGDGEDQAMHPPPGQPLLHLGSDTEDFADTAAIIAELDLVICVDTAVAHLAGALGKPCWVMLPTPWVDWRWMQSGDTSPWYPDVMRLFRQPIAGGWDAVVARMTVELGKWVRR